MFVIYLALHYLDFHELKYKIQLSEHCPKSLLFLWWLQSDGVDINHLLALGSAVLQLHVMVHAWDQEAEAGGVLWIFG